MRNVLLAVLLLAGSLAAQSSHSVALNWTASSDATSNPSLAYNVYRVSADCSTPVLPTFVKQNSTPVTTVTYNDGSVSVGQSYCYRVTSALNGLESAPSNTANAVILPAAPSALVASPK
jgi:hypothetical protein